MRYQATMSFGLGLAIIGIVVAFCIGSATDGSLNALVGNLFLAGVAFLLMCLMAVAALLANKFTRVKEVPAILLAALAIWLLSAPLGAAALGGFGEAAVSTYPHIWKVAGIPALGFLVACFVAFCWNAAGARRAGRVRR